MEGIGKKSWAVPEGYLPTWSKGPDPQMTGHGTLSVLNTNKKEANIQITLYFSDRGPAGPYKFTIPPERTSHLRFNEFEDPEKVPKGKDFASALESDVPVVVQHTRLDSRQEANALMTTMAFPGLD